MQQPDWGLNGSPSLEIISDLEQVRAGEGLGGSEIPDLF